VTLQGVLLDGAGAAMDGEVSLTVRIYADAAGTQVLWTEAQTVTVTDGVFQTLLPAAPTTNPFGATVFLAGEPRWVGLQPQGLAQLPLVPIASVAYAVQALRATEALGLTCTGCVGAAQDSGYGGTNVVGFDAQLDGVSARPHDRAARRRPVRGLA
jgi:hypothetical protein